MLRGKHALVTGSTGGIGWAIASAMATAGANITLNGFGGPSLLLRMQQTLVANHGVSVRVSTADLSNPTEIEEMMAAGPVDILVNNAGMQHISPVEHFSPEMWNAVIAVNLSATFHTTRLALPRMKEGKWGRIINVASAHGLVGSPFKSAYVASKHGVVGFTKAVALEAAGSGVTVNALCPGWVRTDLVERQIETQAEAEGCSIEEAATHLLEEKQPTKQFVLPEQVGGTAVFLCSDAAGQTTGSSISLDGGWTAQ